MLPCLAGLSSPHNRTSHPHLALDPAKTAAPQKIGRDQALTRAEIPVKQTHPTLTVSGAKRRYHEVADALFSMI
jgi:hypothetical protein